MGEAEAETLATRTIEGLAGRTVTLVGLMGAGKTTVGKRLAKLLDLPFLDADAEIEAAARMTIAEIFELYGEPEFRALEARVIARLATKGPQVLATGGGAYMDPETRALLADHAVTVWLKADLDLLMERVAKRKTRPLLQTANPREVMETLMAARDPVYALADVTIETRSVKRDVVAGEVLAALAAHIDGRDTGPSSGDARA